MCRRLWGASWVACMVAVVAAVHGQDGERYDVDPTEKGKRMGVAVYRVERQQPRYAVGADYAIEVVDKSQSVIGTIRFTDRPSDVTTIAYSNARTGQQLEAKYGPGFRWIELRDPRSGLHGRSDFVEKGSEKPSFRKNAAFRRIEAERKEDWEQMFEAASAVWTFHARQKEKYDRQHGPTTPMQPQAGRGPGLVLASSSRQSCASYGACLGVGGGITRNNCCADARQSASNCCGMNQYCIGCCAFGSCDAFCGLGDYACPVCSMLGARCTGPAQNCYGNVTCPQGYMCSGTGCIPMF